jgi:hypothetical protein
MYRIVEHSTPHTEREVARFDSAYDGFDMLRREVHNADRNTAGWRLVTPDGTVLADAADILAATPEPS